MSSKREIKKMITDDLARAIQETEEIVGNREDMFNLLLLLKRELNETEHLHRAGTSDYDTYRRGMNQISLNLLKIIDDLPEDSFSDGTPDKGEREYSQVETDLAALIREITELEIREADSDNHAVKGYINGKRHVVAIQALRTITQHRVSLSSLELSVVAYAFFRNVDLVKAEQIYRMAIENIDEYTDSAQNKIVAMRSYANFLYNINHHEDGAKQYEAAVLKGNGEIDNVTNGYTFLMKFGNECDAQNYSGAIQSYQRAKDYFRAIGNGSVRAYNLSSLEQAWNNKRIPPDFSRP